LILNFKKGFDKTGEECYWNVSGDNVSTISLIKLEDVKDLVFNFFYFKKGRYDVDCWK